MIKRCDIGHTHRRCDVCRRRDLSAGSLGLRLGSHIAVSAPLVISNIPLGSHIFDPQETPCRLQTHMISIAAE